MVYDGGIRSNQAGHTIIDSGVTLRARQRAQETPQERAKRVANELDETYYEYSGNSFDGNLKKTTRLSPLKRDGIIEGSVWNDYVDKHFNSAEEAKQGKHHVKNNIPVADAIKSLNAYYKAQQSGK